MTVGYDIPAGISLKTTRVLVKDIKIKTHREKQRWSRRRMPRDINNLLL